MVLIKIESLSTKELEYIASQEGIGDAAEMGREELIETLREIYEDEDDAAAGGADANVQRRFLYGLTDYRGEASEVTSLPGVEELPDLYSETSVHVMTKNATWLYCYWSVAPLDAEKWAQRWPGHSLGLHVNVEGLDGSSDSWDISVSPSDCEWNISVNAAGGAARVQLALTTADGKTVVLAESEKVELAHSWWLDHPEDIKGSEALLARQLGIATNREGATLSCDTVNEILAAVAREEGF